MSNFEYYVLDDIDVQDAQYNLIFGERSNGKTSAVLVRILENWINKGQKGAYIRRTDDQIKASKAQEVWTSIWAERDLVRKLSQGKWDQVVYRSRKFYLARYDDEKDKIIRDIEPFCYAFALNVAESYKSTSYPDVTTVCFDEFITRDVYIADEFIAFTSMISTIIRQRDNVKIYMLGNTVNKYCPYFDEMGLHRVEDMKQGDIHTYDVGEDTGLKVAVEFCGSSPVGKKSDKFFAFDNPKLRMVTTGVWELPMYPHLPVPYKRNDVEAIFFINFRGKILQGNCVIKDELAFIYLHPKTTEIRDEDHVVYSLEYNPRHNHATDPLGPTWNRMMDFVKTMIIRDRVYFVDNTVGELFRNYMHLASQQHVTNL